MLYTLFIVIALVLAALGWFTRGWWGQRRLAGKLPHARESLANEQSRLEREFIEKAPAAGKPRGLTWVACDFHEGAVLAYDRTTGEVYALRAVTVQFEATPGGGMEEVEAVGSLRYATAVFIYRGGSWTTDGRVVFNLGPQETLEKYHSTLTPLAA